MIKERYQVKENTPNSYYIHDNESSKWRLPSKAVTLYFSDRISIEKVCILMNEEWLRFLRNPN